jgi:hypothetical protein
MSARRWSSAVLLLRMGPIMSSSLPCTSSLLASPVIDDSGAGWGAWGWFFHDFWKTQVFVLLVQENPATRAGPGCRKNINRTESVGMMAKRQLPSGR